MQHDEFLGEVQTRARLSSRGEAERATRATLQTLAEHLTGGAATTLAAQLPPEIGEYLQRVADAGEDFGPDTIFDRVTDREGVARPAAIFHARAVIETTDEATTGALLDHLRAQLPRQYDRALDAAGT